MRPFTDQDRLFTALAALYADMLALADFAPCHLIWRHRRLPRITAMLATSSKDAALLHSAGFGAITLALDAERTEAALARGLYTVKPVASGDFNCLYGAPWLHRPYRGQGAVLLCAAASICGLYKMAGLIYPWHRHLAEELHLYPCR